MWRILSFVLVAAVSDATFAAEPNVMASTAALTDCVKAVALKMEPSKESARDIADAASAEPACEIHIIRLRYAYGAGPLYASNALESARREAMNAVVSKRAARASGKR